MIMRQYYFAIAVIFTSFALAVFTFSSHVFAQEGFDDEVIAVSIKKIRDDESNYLRNVTKATAKEVNKGGEFVAKLYKRNAKGAVIEVQPPIFNFEKYKEGMNTKEMATAGLELVSSVGSLFGFDEESAKVQETKRRLNANNSILNAWGDDEKVMVTMTSRVDIVDEQTGVEINRAINFQKVYDSKTKFVSEKESIIQEAVVAEVKKALAEFLEDLE